MAFHLPVSALFEKWNLKHGLGEHVSKDFCRQKRN
jgi:hypothetical protein